MKSKSVSLFLILTTSLFAAVSYAQSTPQNETEEVRYAVLAFPPASDEPITSVETEFVIDPTEKHNNDEIDQSLQDLLKESEVMRTEEYQESLKTEIRLPMAVEDPALILALKEFSNEDLQKFLDNKGNHIRRAAKVLAFFRKPPEKINAALKLLNEQMFKNPAVIANSNTLNITPGLFTVPFALGFNDWITGYLRKLPYLSNLPPKSGFYVAFSLGISLVVTGLENGKRRIRIEPTLDFRRGESYFSPFAIIAGGGTIMISVEKRVNGKLPLAKGSFLKASFPTFVSGPKIFGLSLPGGYNIIPFGGAAAVIKGQYYRVQLTLATIPILAKAIKDYVMNRIQNCRKAVQSKITN